MRHDSGDSCEDFQPNVTAKENGESSGLGLSVCYGIIRKHNGYIECHSEPGQSTGFRIYLPEVVEGYIKHEGSAALEAEHFDLLFADVNMPIMTGVELLRKIRSKDDEMPVTLMTAYAELIIRVHG